MACGTDEKLLSTALTDALPPLSPGLVTTVADAFRGLDAPWPSPTP